MHACIVGNCSFGTTAAHLARQPSGFGFRQPGNGVNACAGEVIVETDSTNADTAKRIFNMPLSQSRSKFSTDGSPCGEDTPAQHQSESPSEEICPVTRDSKCASLCSLTQANGHFHNLVRRGMMRYVSIFAITASTLFFAVAPASAWSEQNCISQCQKASDASACINQYNCAQYRGKRTIPKSQEQSATDAWLKRQNK
jgi:hypothetical protein